MTTPRNEQPDATRSAADVARQGRVPVAVRRQHAAEYAAQHLIAAEPRFAPLIASVGIHHPHIKRDPFRVLVASITQQQVSMKAGEAIFRRVCARCPGGRLTPAAILAVSTARLRSAGLSRQKASYVHNVAEAFGPGGLTRRKLNRLGDDEVIATVSQIKGIGRWTVEMLLIFCLERPDVWPVDDLGLRRAAERFYGLNGDADRATLTVLGEPLRPYRSYASWYLWRYREGTGMPGQRVSRDGSDA